MNEFGRLDIVSRETFNIPALSRPYKVVQITDAHVSAAYEDEAAPVQDAAPRRARVFYATPESSVETWFSLVEKANAEKPDLVVLTGDIVDFPSRRNLDVLAEGLHRLQAPYVFCVGNHDWSFDFDYHTANAVATELPKFAHFSRNGTTAYSLLDMGEFSVLAVDNSLDQVAEEALTGWHAACALQKPVILALHVPFCADDFPENGLRAACEVWGSYGCMGENGIKPNATTARFIEAVTADDSPVAAVLAGHLHFEHRDRLTEKIDQHVSAAFSIISLV